MEKLDPSSAVTSEQIILPTAYSYGGFAQVRIATLPLGEAPPPANVIHPAHPIEAELALASADDCLEPGSMA